MKRARSQKQRAHAQHYGKVAQPIRIAPRNSGLPKESWWVGIDRETFDRIARTEAERMKLSSFGNPTRRSQSGEAL